MHQVCHLPLIKASVSREAAPAANACAVSCFGIGQIVGNQLGGVVVAHIGAAGAYGAGCGWSLAAFLLMFCVKAPLHAPAPTTADLDVQMLAETPPVEPKVGVGGRGKGSAAGWRELVGSKEYLGVFAVTFLGNLFFWAHITFIQVLATELGAGPAAAGTLASATGWGNVVGCLGCAVLAPRRIGLVFTLGMLVCSPKFTVALSHSSLDVYHIPFCWKHGRALLGAWR